MTTDEYEAEILLVQQIVQAWVANGRKMNVEPLSMLVIPEKKTTKKKRTK